jgi:multidrug resistance efflux pump
MAAQPSFGRAQARIERAAAALEAGAKGVERRRHLSRSRAGWRARHDTMATLFTQLRGLQKLGVDKDYDTFLASWGKTLSTVESVAENTGGDQKELETSFGALQVFADELAGAMIDANVSFCDPFMPREERETLDG